MIGAIIGDIIGSAHEWKPIKTTDFKLIKKPCRFTDDTVMTVATAHAILHEIPYGRAYKQFGCRFPDAGYGASFKNWLGAIGDEPYNSWGNGSAMRVSPVGFAFNSVDKILDQARQSAEVTHNHPEGIKGAQATALSIFMARIGSDKPAIKAEIASRFGYDLDRTIEQIRPAYTFDVSCQGSVPEAIIAFLESTDYESAIRLAVSLGGDADTQACIAGGIAQAFYKDIPADIIKAATALLPTQFVSIINEFNKKYPLDK